MADHTASRLPAIPALVSRICRTPSPSEWEAWDAGYADGERAYVNTADFADAADDATAPLPTPADAEELLRTDGQWAHVASAFRTDPDAAVAYVLAHHEGYRDRARYEAEIARTVVGPAPGPVSDGKIPLPAIRRFR